MIGVVNFLVEISHHFLWLSCDFSHFCTPILKNNNNFRHPQFVFFVRMRYENFKLTSKRKKKKE